MKAGSVTTIARSAGPVLVPLCFIALLSLASVLSPSAAATDALVIPLPSPAPAHSQLSRLTRDGAGHVYLSWVVERDDVAELQYAQLRGEQWSDPEAIARGADWFINWADFPVLSVSEGAKVAHWLSRSGAGTYDYDITARFFDSTQRSPSRRVRVNDDGVGAEHGFVSMLPMDGRTLIAWLDGRNTKRVPVGGPMSLRAAVFARDGARVTEWELDARVCDCCQTAAAMTEQGPVVVYRDRSPEEVRDIAIVRLVDGQWSQPAPVSEDNWRVLGCPVNGPAVSAFGNRVAVAWFSAKDELPTVRLSLSSDSGATFASPVTVATANTNGRVDIALLESGEIVVSWLETLENSARITLSRFSPEGVFLDATEVAQTSASRRSGFPTMESVGNEVFVSWTDVSAAQVRVARVSYASGP